MKPTEGGHLVGAGRVEDGLGNQETSGGLVVTFVQGTGTGQGTFSAITDHGDGTYTATFTATLVGSNTITATIGGQAITGAAPRFTGAAATLTVTPGKVSPAQSMISISSASRSRLLGGKCSDSCPSG